LEARDLRRRRDAEERAAKRDKAESKRDDAGAPKPLPDAGGRPNDQVDKGKADAENRQKFEERQKAHATEQTEKEKSDAENRAKFLERQKAQAEEQDKRKQKDAAEAPERDANVKAFDEKQRDAADYAKRKEAERVENEKRREQRRQERERQQKELENQAKQ